MSIHYQTLLKSQSLTEEPSARPCAPGRQPPLRYQACGRHPATRQEMFRAARQGSHRHRRRALHLSRGGGHRTLASVTRGESSDCPHLAGQERSCSARASRRRSSGRCQPTVKRTRGFGDSRLLRNAFIPCSIGVAEVEYAVREQDHPRSAGPGRKALHKGPSGVRWDNHRSSCFWSFE